GSWAGSWLHPLAEPVDDAGEEVADVLALAEAVALARVDDEAGLDAALLEAAPHLVGLTDRADGVLIAVDEERRGLDGVEVVDRRAEGVEAVGVVGIGAVEGLVEALDRADAVE